MSIRLVIGMLFLSRLIAVALAVIAIQPVCAEPITHSEIRVVDGDTIDARGHRWRMIGYDTPETRSTWRYVSPTEKMVGETASERLKELLQTGKLDLTEQRCACSDRKIAAGKCNHNRKCGLLTRDGENIGDQLIKENLAVKFVCGRTKCPRMPDWPSIISKHQHPQ